MGDELVRDVRLPTSRYPGPYNPYPRSYNPRVHGPYDPTRYYGNNPRPSIWNIKLGNMVDHIMTSDFSRPSLANTFTRWVSRYHERHFRVRKRPMNPIFQFWMIGVFLGFLNNYGFSQETRGGRQSERRYKYH